MHFNGAEIMTTVLFEGSSAVRMVNGRLVSRSLSDPEVRVSIAQQMAELRKDPAALREWYVRRGMINSVGKLTPRFGG